MVRPRRAERRGDRLVGRRRGRIGPRGGGRNSRRRRRRLCVAGPATAVFLADPARTDALADELLPWLLDQREVVQLMTFAGDLARVRAFERHGLRYLRS